MYTTRRVLVGTVIALTFITVSMNGTRSRVKSMRPTVQLPPLTLAPFTSVELRDGVKAALHYGATQYVTLLKGSPEISRVTVAGAERLLIDKCRDKCPRGYELEVEIVTPAVVGISVSSGGTIESRGSFPRQAEISVAVDNGGTIDARPIPADKITAAVSQGGRILVSPQTAMFATVDNGGMIIYWGDARVTSSTQHGGQVAKGAVADADKPLSDFGAADSCSPKPPKTSRVRSVVMD